jgi:hypothetical protein
VPSRFSGPRRDGGSLRQSVPDLKRPNPSNKTGKPVEFTGSQPDVAAAAAAAASNSASSRARTGVWLKNSASRRWAYSSLQLRTKGDYAALYPTP